MFLLILFFFYLCLDSCTLDLIKKIKNKGKNNSSPKSTKEKLALTTKIMSYGPLIPYNKLKFLEHFDFGFFN